MKTRLKLILPAMAGSLLLAGCATPRYWSSDDRVAYEYVCRPGHAIKYRVASAAQWPPSKVWDGGSCAWY